MTADSDITVDLLTDLEAAESLLQSAESAGPVSGKWVAKSLGEVAEFFGLSVQTVKQWRMESPAMPGIEGQWPLADIVRWRHAKLAGSDLNKAYKNEQLESSRLKNDALKLELQKSRGEVISRDKIRLELSLAMSALRNRLGNFGYHAANLVPSDCKLAVKQSIDVLMDRTLKELCNDIEQLKGSSHDDDE